MLADLFALSALTWSRPEDCTRYPITLKLADRFLEYGAAEYDEDEIELLDIPKNEEAAA